MITIMKTSFHSDDKQEIAVKMMFYFSFNTAAKIVILLMIFNLSTRTLFLILLLTSKLWNFRQNLEINSTSFKLIICSNIQITKEFSILGN